MATGWPMKVSYANGDVFSASDVNDTNGTINLLGASVAYAAGKNKIINGDFRFNQRAFTSNTTSGSYNFDRWLQGNVGGTVTTTPQTFTAGTAPVAGYEGVNFVQVAVTGQSAAGDFAQYLQKIEDVRTFAGQTVTISFWAKASSGTPKLSVEMIQQFGSGGSGDVNTSASAATTLSTSWARYSTTIAIPSISGKTIGTGSCLQTTFWLSSGSTYASRANSIGIQTATFQIWGVQVESGSTATAFQTATGTIQGELAACQRYYQRFGGETAYQTLGSSYNVSTTKTNAIIALPVPMRVIPTSLDSSTLCIQDSNDSISGTLTSVAFANAGNQTIRITGNSTGMTDNLPGALLTNNSTSAYIGFSAEL
jgi:hypothetical protein